MRVVHGRRGVERSALDDGVLGDKSLPDTRSAPGFRSLLLGAALVMASCGTDQSMSSPATPTSVTPTSGTPTPTPEPVQTWPRDGAFTDSQGRTILYRLYFRNEWDTNEPRGVVVSLHGSNTGSQRQMTEWFDASREALEQGVAYAALGSPEATDQKGLSGPWPSIHFPNRVGSGTGGRYWVDADKRLVHELLQSGFSESFVVDYDQIVFWGGSAGTIFLTRFLEQYIGLYGGGFYAQCGTLWLRDGRSEWSPRPPARVTDDWAPSFPWGPSSGSPVREKFRVFIQITTGDFLHEFGIPMARYYGEVLGLETGTDLDSPGGHCARGTTSAEEVFRWLLAANGRDSTRTGSDHDGDGIADAVDDDDDNDGAWDVMDALPLDARDWRDTDGDGLGDFEDRDADGDGVNNDEDRFSLDPREWKDADGDGIGDNLDDDDDNDGLPDATDSQPLEGVTGDQLSFHQFGDRVRDHGPAHASALVHAGKPAAFVYPDSQGNRQSYQFIRLGNGADATFQIMIDRTERRSACHLVLLPELCDDPPSAFAYFEHHVDQIYVDRNQNGDLTDDGPPLVLARNRGDRFDLPSVGTMLEVSYASGDRLPFGMRFWTTQHLDEGMRYVSRSGWRGSVHPPTGEPVLVGVVDADSDGLFNSSGNNSDWACVDTNRNGLLLDCHQGSLRSGDTFELDGRTFRLEVSPTGHRVEITSVR